MKLLYSDQNLSLYKKYHVMNKLLIPGIFMSCCLHCLDNKMTKSQKQINKFVDLVNVVCVSFHSFHSMNAVITDYHRKIFTITSKIPRGANLTWHILSTIGYLNYIAKN